MFHTEPPGKPCLFSLCSVAQLCPTFCGPRDHSLPMQEMQDSSHSPSLNVIFASPFSDNLSRVESTLCLSQHPACFSCSVSFNSNYCRITCFLFVSPLTVWNTSAWHSVTSPAPHTMTEWYMITCPRCSPESGLIPHTSGPLSLSLFFLINLFILIGG